MHYALWFDGSGVTDLTVEVRKLFGKYAEAPCIIISSLFIELMVRNVCSFTGSQIHREVRYAL